MLKAGPSTGALFFMKNNQAAAGKKLVKTMLPSGLLIKM